MKKLTAVSLFFVFLILFILPVGATGQIPIPELNCGSSILVDATSGNSLYEKYADVRGYPASTTKVLTACLALEKGAQWQQAAISNNAVRAIGINGSKVGLKPGEKVYVNDLLHMALIPSGNDAANAIAEAVSGSTAAFVKLMNQKAMELGMTQTTFLNPIGLDKEDGFKGHMTTTRDMAILMRYATSNTTFRTIIGKESYQLPKTNLNSSRPIVGNTNLLLTDSQLQSASYKVIGGKTGYTKAAKHVLVVSARNSEGIELIAVLMNNPNRSQMFKDAKKLFDYGFSIVNTQPGLATKGFYDLRNRPSESEINELYQRGILSGSGNGSFDYAAPASKEMFIKILFNMKGLSLESMGSDWSLPYLKKALDMGLIDDEWFSQKNSPVTASEVLSVLSKMTGGEYESLSNPVSPLDGEKTLSREELVLLLYRQAK